MPRLADLETALINADKAGDTNAARMLAAEIVRERQGATETVDPTEGMSGTEKFLAGAGKAFTDIGRGIRQVFDASNAVTLTPEEAQADPETAEYLSVLKQQSQALQDEIAESRRLDAPLMKTGAGIAGNITGNIAAAAPATFIPGANTLAGATAIGGVMGALQPTVQGESRLENTALGASAGTAGYAVGKTISSGISAAKGRIAKLAAEKSANVARDDTLTAARQSGYVVPPSEVDPGFVTNILEKWAGKAAVSQSASLKNQKVTNRLVRESLGLPKDTPITPDTLEPIKQAAWTVYESTRKLGTLTADKQFDDAINAIAGKSTKLNPLPGVDDLVERLKQGTFDADDVVTAIQTFKGNASTRLKPMNTDVVSRNLGKAEAKAAEALEGLIERNLGGEALKTFKAARVTLGKVGTVERAMIESTGDVSARKLAQDLAKGKPLTGELRTAAKFAQAYPRSNQLNVNPIPGGSPLDVAAAGISVAAGNPGIGSLLLARPLARGAVMSSMFQRQQNYSPLASLAVSKLPNLPRTAQSLGILAPSISVSNR